MVGMYLPDSYQNYVSKKLFDSVPTISPPTLADLLKKKTGTEEEEDMMEKTMTFHFFFSYY